MLKPGCGEHFGSCDLRSHFQDGMIQGTLSLQGIDHFQNLGQALGSLSFWGTIKTSQNGPVGFFLIFFPDS